MIFFSDFVFEIALCNVKHFFTLSTLMELSCVTFGMLLCIHGDCKQQLKVLIYLPAKFSSGSK